MDRSGFTILDGAMGTRLYKAGLRSGQCPEKWVLEHADVAADIQRSYVNAGSQVIYTPTFGANSSVLGTYGLAAQVKEYNLRLVEISKTASCGKALIAGDISSTGKMLSPMGPLSFEDMHSIYYEQAAALEKAGVDLFVIETMTNIAEARAALLAVKAVSNKKVYVSFTCNETGRTMMGSDVCAALQIMQRMGADAFGLNCSTGPGEMLKQIRRLAEFATIPLIAKPNAGLPITLDGETVYNVNSEEFAEYVPLLVEAGASLIGACCGSDEKYISAISEKLNGISPVFSVHENRSDSICGATEKNVFTLDEDAACSVILDCNDDLEDALYDSEADEITGIRITCKEDCEIFAEAQYASQGPVCIICDDRDLLEKALRAYQGTALYEGTVPAEVLEEYQKKYGLILR